MSIVKILAVIVVTAVVTLLCIRSGQAMAKTPMPSPSPPPSPPAGTVYQPVTVTPESHKPEIRKPEVSKPEVHLVHSGNASNFTPVSYVNSTRLESSKSTTATSISVNSVTNATFVSSGSISNATSARSGLASNVSSARSGSALNATSVNRTNPTVSTVPVTRDQKENGSIVLQPSTANRTFTKSGDGGGGDTQATSRSLVHSTPSTNSRRRALPIVVRGKLIRQSPYPANHKAGNNVEEDRSDDEEDDHDGGDDNNEANIIVDAGVYHVNDGPYLRQMDHNNQYTTLKDADTSVAQEDGSAGYHNSYDVTYAVGSHGANDGTGWNPVTRPVQHTHGSGGGGSTHPGGTPVYPMGRPPPYVPYPYPIGFIPAMPGYKQNPMPPNYPHYQQPYNNGGGGGGGGHQVEQYNVYSPLQQIQMITEKIDWQKIGILALFKVGLAKLKAFGFLKILFLLVFKLKMFLIAVFFKFLLIVKLMKFFKLLMIPLIFLALLPIIASLFSAPMLVGGLLSIPSRILQYLTEPVYAPVPGVAVAATKNSAAPGSGAPPLPTVTSAKSGDLNALIDRRRLETLELFDPAMSVFRKLLDSEKCVERIACRMAVVEKTGVLPVWINWVLHQVSKFIPNEKLESYLKAYDDVNKEFYNQSETPDNWATWCVERYDCNTAHSSASAINVTETKQ